VLTHAVIVCMAHARAQPQVFALLPLTSCATIDGVFMPAIERMLTPRYPNRLATIMDAHVSARRQCVTILFSDVANKVKFLEVLRSSIAVCRLSEEHRAHVAGTHMTSPHTVSVPKRLPPKSPPPQQMTTPTAFVSPVASASRPTEARRAAVVNHGHVPQHATLGPHAATLSGLHAAAHRRTSLTEAKVDERQRPSVGQTAAVPAVKGIRTSSGFTVEPSDVSDTAHRTTSGAGTMPVNGSGTGIRAQLMEQTAAETHISRVVLPGATPVPPAMPKALKLLGLTPGGGVDNDGTASPMKVGYQPHKVASAHH
jgi:hypothetical protein